MTRKSQDVGRQRSRSNIRRSRHGVGRAGGRGDIALQIERGFVRRAMKKAIQQTMDFGARASKCGCWVVSAAPRSRCGVVSRGKIPLHTLRQPIDTVLPKRTLSTAKSGDSAGCVRRRGALHRPKSQPR